MLDCLLGSQIKEVQSGTFREQGLFLYWIKMKDNGATLLAIIATVLAVYLTVSTIDYRYEIEHENEGLKLQLKLLKAKIADPSKFCREYYFNKMKGKK